MPQNMSNPRLSVIGGTAACGMQNAKCDATVIG